MCIRDSLFTDTIPAKYPNPTARAQAHTGRSATGGCRPPVHEPNNTNAIHPHRPPSPRSASLAAPSRGPVVRPAAKPKGGEGATRARAVFLFSEVDAVANCHVGSRSAPLAAGARLIAAPTPRRLHLARRETALHRRQNKREVAARPRQQKHRRSLLLLVSSRLVAGAHARDPRRSARTRPPGFEPAA